MSLPQPNDRWYYARDKKKMGPATLAELRRLLADSALEPADLVLQEGTQKWRPLAEVVAVKPEVIVKYGTRADEAGAAKVSSVGESQLGVPLESVPQQCHKLLVEFQTTSGRAWSTTQK